MGAIVLLYHFLGGRHWSPSYPGASNFFFLLYNLCHTCIVSWLFNGMFDPHLGTWQRHQSTLATTRMNVVMRSYAMRILPTRYRGLLKTDLSCRIQARMT